jgi:hypothetical protein
MKTLRLTDDEVELLAGVMQFAWLSRDFEPPEGFLGVMYKTGMAAEEVRMSRAARMSRAGRMSRARRIPDGYRIDAGLMADKGESGAPPFPLR